MFEFFKQSLKSNIKKFYVQSFLEALSFPGAIWILYLLKSGLSLEKVGLLVSVMFLTQFIFEIPSSILADRYSRKNILIIGTIFSVLSSILFFSGNSFVVFLLAVVFSGIYASFVSGTDHALIYDTLLNLKKENDYKKIQSKIKGIYFLGRAINSFFIVFVYMIDFKLPFLIGAIVGLLGLFTLVLIKEPLFQKSSGAHLNQIKEGLKFLLSHENTWLIVLVFSLMSATSDILFTNYQPVLDFAGLPILYFSLVYLAVNIFSFAGSMLYPCMEKTLSVGKILAGYLFIAFFVSLFFASGNLIFILIAILALSFSFGSYNVYITSLINKITPSSHRATTISIQSLINMFIIGIVIIFVNKISSDYSIFYGMILNAGIILIAFLGFLFVKINNRKKLR
ncbi:MFS transporter [Patescibacteria group bacterium]|nr:MFS transporter [Patescibacteria group bacterium]MBU4580428.1 MFS transporter [Patescibacteria group bacterium]